MTLCWFGFCFTTPPSLLFTASDFSKGLKPQSLHLPGDRTAVGGCSNGACQNASLAPGPQREHSVILCLIPSGPSGVSLSVWDSPGGPDHCGADKSGYLLLRLAFLPSASVETVRSTLVSELRGLLLGSHTFSSYWLSPALLKHCPGPLADKQRAPYRGAGTGL